MGIFSLTPKALAPPSAYFQRYPLFVPAIPPEEPGRFFGYRAEKGWSGEGDMVTRCRAQTGSSQTRSPAKRYLPAATRDREVLGQISTNYICVAPGKRTRAADFAAIRGSKPAGRCEQRNTTDGECKLAIAEGRYSLRSCYCDEKIGSRRCPTRSAHPTNR